MAEKLKLGCYWAASCGGCEIAVLDIAEEILEVTKRVEIHFWPVAIDTKYRDIKEFPDGLLDACFFNGAVRTEENEEMARLLRQKSKLLVAFGACACEGGIPGLANLSNREGILEAAYLKNLSTPNPEGKTPQTRFKAPEGELSLPELYDTVHTLAQVVKVDYYLPGCPPPVKLILEAVNKLIEGKLPEPGSVLAPQKGLCDECERNTEEARVMPEIHRVHELILDPKRCFLDQGLICMGPATRAGCDARCINANMPCTGCMGPLPGILDQGAKLLSGIGSIIRVEDEKNVRLEELKRLIGKVKDPVGTFYMYGLPNSILRRRR